MPRSETDRFVSIPCALALLLFPMTGHYCSLFFSLYNNSLNLKYPCSSAYGRARQLNIRAPVCWNLVSKLPRWIALLSVSAVLNLTKFFLGLHKINIPKELFSSRNTILLAFYWHFLHISLKKILDSGCLSDEAFIDCYSFISRTLLNNFFWLTLNNYRTVIGHV